MNSYNSNWDTPYYSLIVTAGEFQKCNLRWKLDLLLWPRDQETEFSVEVCLLSQTQEGQTE